MNKFSVVSIFIFLFVISVPESVNAADSMTASIKGQVTSITEDNDGFVWFGTRQGLYRYTGSVYTRFLSTGNPEDIVNDNINDLCRDADGRIWIGTMSGIVMINDGEINNPYLSFHTPVYKILDFDKDNVIAAVRNGILKVAKESFTGVSLHRDVGINSLQDVVVSRNGDIWYVKSLDGKFILTVLDHDFNVKVSERISGLEKLGGIALSPDNTVLIASGSTIISYDANTARRIDTPAPLASVSSGGEILFMNLFKESSILVGVKGEGLFVYDFRNGRSEKIYPDRTLDKDSYVCFVDSSDNIWLSDETSEPDYLHSNRLFSTYSITGIPDSPIKSLSVDSKGTMWFASYDTYGSYDLRSNSLVWSKREPYGITGMHLSPEGFLWTISDYNKVIKYSISGSVPAEVGRYTFPYDVNYISGDGKGELWVFMAQKVNVISAEGAVEDVELPQHETIFTPTFVQKDPGSGKVFLINLDQTVYECYDRKFLLQDLFNLKSISTIFTASDASVWVGTSNNGIHHIFPSEHRIESFSQKDGLPEGDIRTILEDRSGNVWLSSATRMTRYGKNESTFQTFNEAVRNGGKYYEPNCGVSTSDGTLIFGGSGGITTFVPTEKSAPDMVPIPIRCLRVSVDGKTVANKSIPVVMKSRDRLLSVIYSGINFVSGSLLNYSYKLEGKDRDWIYTGEQSLSFSNLSPGKYNLRVRVRLFTGEWSEDELTIPITVKASVWNSRASKIAYMLLGLLAIWLSFRTARKMIRQRNDLLISKQNEIMKQEQVEFLTNTSHEFRTPLSLIYAPLKILNAKSGLSAEDKKLLSTALENTERLKTLADKSLRPSFEDVSDSVLRVVPCNISSLVKGIAENFGYAAHQKEIDFSYDVKDDVNGYADTEKVEKVLLNILSNAFKYTPEHGKVELSLCTEDGKAVVEVKDNGIGIPEDKRKDIFKRFNRLGREKDADLATGSGIGLNYAIRLARSHKGDINYRPNGEKGSIFSFSFPYLEESFSADEMHNRIEVEEQPVNAGESSGNASSRHSKTVLVAEDNADVRSFLRNLLSSQYNVITCNNGAEAWDNISILAPDVILSDIVMPMKDGYALCAEVKGNEDYCHIPVVLLTAKSDAASNIRGLNAGADAYIPKPFDPEHLLATIENLLANRARVQQKVSNLTASSMKDEKMTREAELNSSDRKFLEKLQKSVENHLNDESFKVNQLAAEIKMSHSGLYSKVKALTGHSPQTYINTYRMNVAMEMLKTGEFTIAEVADSIGSSSVSNFSRDFKKHFGITPSSV